MLILPKGYKQWKEDISITESEGLLHQKTKYETGEIVTEEIDKSADMLGTVMKWHLPDNFCPNCGRNDVSPEEAADGSDGMYTFNEAHPELLMLPRDVIIYGQCGPCRRTTLWGVAHTKVQLPPGYTECPAQRVKQNLVDYIKAKIQRGDKPCVEGHSYQGSYV